MMKKKDYPLEVIELLSEINKIDYDFIEVDIAKKYLLQAKDLDEESDFYFNIESFNNSTTYYDHESVDSIKYRVSRKPKNRLFPSETTEELNNFFVLQEFQNWAKIIIKYNHIDLTPKDPILAFYEDEFYNRFKIIDLDAEKNPYELVQQLALSKHLDNIIETFNESTEIDSLQIVNESILLKNNLTTATKADVFRKLCRIWGMVRKKGIDILKVILTKGFDKLIELSISKGFDGLMELF